MQRAMLTLGWVASAQPRIPRLRPANVVAPGGSKRSVNDLARTSTDPDERADFFEHDAGRRELA